MIGAIIEWIAGPLGVAAGAVLAILAAWVKGKTDGRQKAEKQAMQDYIKTREAMDDVEVLPDPDLARRWLHERGKQ